MKRAVFLVFLLCVPLGASAATVIPVDLHSATGIHRYRLEVAATEEEQEKGLMFRRKLDRHGGMIFPQTRPGPAFMWMKNTYLPLDLVFVGRQGAVIKLIEHAEPFDETPIGTAEAVTATIELPAGAVAEDRLAVGDRVDYRWPVP